MNMVDEQPGVRATQKARTREAVLAAARDEFEAVGFEAANVRSIARRAGVSAGTVLHHFHEKRDLLHAALFDDLEATLDRALSRVGKGSLAKEASALGAAVFGFYQKRPALSRAALREALFAEGPWAQAFLAQVQRVHQALAVLARRDVDKGRLVRTVSPEVLGAAWLSFFYFALIGWVQGGVPAPLPLLKTLFAQHLAGLSPRSSR
jgi:AcrR family transcriptional regulator